MAVTIRRANLKLRQGSGGKRKGRKTPAEVAKEKMISMEESLSNFHHKTDDELAEFIEPLPGKENNATHRLNEEQREARLVLIHRMMIRKVSPEEIRNILGISMAMYYKLKNVLDTRMRLDTSKVDVPYLIGDTLAFYDEVRSMALTMSSSAAIKSPNVKISAMQVALRAEQDKNEFLASCGVYSAPVVEHIVRGMVSTGNFNVVDGQTMKALEAQEINVEMASRLRQFVQQRAANCIEGSCTSEAS